MSINLAQIKSLLLPGLNKLTGDYPSIETQYSKIFTKVKSTLTVETSVQMRYFGLAQYKTEGGATNFDNNAGERYKYNAETKEVGLAFSITRKAIDDNQYKSQFAPSVKGLMDSFKEFRENNAAAICNTATTYDSLIGGDTKALCATDHPVDGSTWANKFSTEQSLNETSLLNACTNIRSIFVDEAGLKRKFRAKRLLVPPNLAPVAHRLLKTELRPGTANNDVNAIVGMDGGLKDYYIWDYLSSNYAWFVTTNVDGLIVYERKPFESDMHTDFLTDNLLVKGYERYLFSYRDPRAIYGSFPTS